MDAALQVLAGQLGEPSLDLIDPGGGCRCEVDVPVRSACQPCLDRGSLVGGVVVHDDVDVQPVRYIAVDHLEEVEELLRAVAPVAPADDEAGGSVKGGEQRGGAVACRRQPSAGLNGGLAGRPADAEAGRPVSAGASTR